MRDYLVEKTSDTSFNLNPKHAKKNKPYILYGNSEDVTNWVKTLSSIRQRASQYSFEENNRGYERISQAMTQPAPPDTITERTKKGLSSFFNSARLLVTNQDGEKEKPAPISNPDNFKHINNPNNQSPNSRTSKIYEGAPLQKKKTKYTKEFHKFKKIITLKIINQIHNLKKIQE